ncbi:MAG: SprT-like domain-containing protein [Muribaculaceae bacterium]|nr:SprT-like domain-containing protein [Muribaculaceae bacterium]
MIPTLSYLRRHFDIYNSQFFDSALPVPRLAIGKAAGRLGSFSAPVLSADSVLSSSHLSRCCIRISACYDYPEPQLQDVIIHEMIHFHVWYHRLHDSSPHGPIFRSIMEHINKAGNRHISVSMRILTPSQATEQKIITKVPLRNPRLRYVCVTHLTDNGLGITIVPRTQIFPTHLILSSHSIVRSLEWYISRDQAFDPFPTSRKVKIYRLSPDLYARIPSLARPCICDGMTFRLLPRR